jgi:hypothetical protein
MSEILAEMKKREDGKVLLDTPAEQVAELEQAGVLTGLARTEVFGLPAGKAAAALFAVGGWDALRGFIPGVIPAGVPEWVVPAIGAWAMSTKTVSGWVGSDAANAAGLILLADALQASPFSPRKLVRDLFSGIRLGQPATASFSSNGGSKEQSLAEFLRS